MSAPIFDHTCLKVNEITFSFPELAPACKKLLYFINSFIFTIEQIQLKLMTKFFNKFKKAWFWPILVSFSQFLGQKKSFPENLVLPRATSPQLMIQLQCLDRQKDGQKDGLSLFWRTLLPTAGDRKSADLIKRSSISIPKSICLL